MLNSGSRNNSVAAILEDELTWVAIGLFVLGSIAIINISIYERII
jgi:hypothetical protein